MRTPIAELTLALALLTGTLSVHADDDWHDEDNSYDRARRASERGEILPLSQLLARIRAELPGQVLQAELEREGSDWVYELKILDPQGRLLGVHADARTGRLLDRGDD